MDKHAGQDTVVLTLGNELLGDDGAGILFGRLLTGQDGHVVIEGGTAPENTLGLVERESPANVLIADAMDFGGIPGEWCIVKPDKITAGAISTHGSTQLCIEYLIVTTCADITVLGFQPLQLGFGDRCSSVVIAGVVKAAELYGSGGIPALTGTFRKGPSDENALYCTGSGRR